MNAKWCKRGNPNLGVLGELRRKKGERGLREREDEEKERAEEPMERTRVTEKRNVQSERERWREEKVQADGETRARQLESQAWLSFRCTHLRNIVSVGLNGEGRFP